MHPKVILAILLFIISIIHVVVGIIMSNDGDPSNWLFLLAGCVFLVGGVICFVQARRDQKAQSGN